MTRKVIWRFCCICSVLLSILTFTPLVIPSEIVQPFILGIPRTLWAGLIVSLGFMVVTIVGAFVANSEEGGDF